MNKKILIASLVTLASVAGVVGTVGNAHKVEAANNKTIYVDDSVNVLNKSVDWVWSWKTGGSGVAYDLKDTDSDGILEASIPEENDWVIFVSSGSKGSWSNQVQTGNISLPTDGSNLYTFTTLSKGVWSKFGQEISNDSYVTSLLETYYNFGRYVRDSEIYLDKSNADYEAAVYFHNSVEDLVRTTYFDGELLWMNNANGVNSGYSVNKEGKMNHFTFNDGVKTEDYTTQHTGVESYYTTLQDILGSISEAQNWEATANGYSSKNPALIKQFGLFTAPCFLGFDKDTENLLDFERVEIQEINSKLEMRLYVASTSKGWVTNQTTCLFSKATISLPSTKVAIAGTFNDWNASYDLMPTDKAGIYYTEVSLTAATHELKVVYNGSWYGNSGTIDGECFDWEFKTSDPSNCKLTITEAGRYALTFNTTTKKLSVKPI